MRSIASGEVTAVAITRIEAIIRHEADAERIEGEAAQLHAKADYHRWKAAELIAAELIEPGQSLRALAESIGKSREHVRLMAKIWAVWQPRLSEVDEPPSFNAVYHSSEIRGTSRRPSPALPSVEDLAGMLVEDDQIAEAVAAAMIRAREIARDKLSEQHPRHQRTQRAQALNEAGKEFHNALNALHKFAELYLPENRANAEQLAKQLESAALIIRQRVAGIE